MKMKILVFGGSSSSSSINKQLAVYCSTFFSNSEIQILDLNDFEMPIYSIDKELKNGIHPLAIEFAKEIDEADLILTSLAEHNGSYSTAFKNILDWVSRIPNRTIFANKPMFLMSTSPGVRGGMNVLETAKKSFPYSGANILETFSLPTFQDFFDVEKGITDIAKKEELIAKTDKIKISFSY